VFARELEFCLEGICSVISDREHRGVVFAGEAATAGLFDDAETIACVDPAFA
jgi:hypothetical protein